VIDGRPKPGWKRVLAPVERADGEAIPIHAIVASGALPPKAHVQIHRAALGFTIFILVAVTILGIFFLDTRGYEPRTGLPKLFKELGTMITSPRSEHFKFLEALGEIGVTLALGALTTVIGAVGAIIVGPLAAANLAPKPVVTAIKGFVAFLRAVPTVIWVLIFAVSAGLGSVAAVVGMSFHSFGYLIKAYSEAFEDIDASVIEALRASGATWFQVVWRAVIPSSTSALVSWTFIRFEINFTNAVAMGAAAGAGGVGYDLFMASNFYFNIGEVGYITYLILAIAILLEVGATRLKSRAHVQR
jgi:phosphonate transport system permease protein